MGLLSPTEGELRVDNKLIDRNSKRSWQRHISNVPQHIYLTDGTIEENIAFGVPKDLIEIDKLEKAARQAQIAELIEELDEGYQTLVGER